MTRGSKAVTPWGSALLGGRGGGVDGICVAGPEAPGPRLAKPVQLPQVLSVVPFILAETVPAQFPTMLRSNARTFLPSGGSSSAWLIVGRSLEPRRCRQRSKYRCARYFIAATSKSACKRWIDVRVGSLALEGRAGRPGGAHLPGASKLPGSPPPKSHRPVAQNLPSFWKGLQQAAGIAAIHFDPLLTRHVLHDAWVMIPGASASSRTGGAWRSHRWTPRAGIRR